MYPLSPLATVSSTPFNEGRNILVGIAVTSLKLSNLLVLLKV